MIDYLRGPIRHVETDYLVIEAGGVGYRVFCANPYAFGAPGDGEKTVYIHHHVREDAILLFGFASREEQSLFRKLLDVSGIGPRVALGILSGGRPEALVAAIRNEDLGYLTRLPGIGKKTAQRIVLDLKDKLSDAPVAATGGPGLSAAPRAETEDDRGGALREAKEGLLALGFTEAEIASVWPHVQSGAEAGASADALMKAALKQLYRK